MEHLLKDLPFGEDFPSHSSAILAKLLRPTRINNNDLATTNKTKFDNTCAAICKYYIKIGDKISLFYCMTCVIGEYIIASVDGCWVMKLATFGPGEYWEPWVASRNSNPIPVYYLAYKYYMDRDYGGESPGSQSDLGACACMFSLSSLLELEIALASSSAE